MELATLENCMAFVNCFSEHIIIIHYSVPNWISPLDTDNDTSISSYHGVYRSVNFLLIWSKLKWKVGCFNVNVYVITRTNKFAEFTKKQIRIELFYYRLSRLALLWEPWECSCLRTSSAQMSCFLWGFGSDQHGSLLWCAMKIKQSRSVSRGSVCTNKTSNFLPLSNKPYTHDNWSVCIEAWTDRKFGWTTALSNTDIRETDAFENSLPVKSAFLMQRHLNNGLIDLMQIPKDDLLVSVEEKSE